MNRGLGRAIGSGKKNNRNGRAIFAAFEMLESRTMLSVVQPLDIGQFKGRPGQFGEVNGVTLFTTTDFPNGQMLWATDGTAQGTRLVKDLETRSAAAASWFIGGRDNALTVGNTFYFTGVDNAHGRELWRSDGTAAGTWMVKDLVPGAGDSDPEGFVALGNQLLFTANKQLWRSDGTAEGTVMIKDADPLGNYLPERMAVRGQFAYFMVYPQSGQYNNDHNTGELWRTDGTAGGTVMVRDVSPQPFDPVEVTPARGELINVAGTLYFTANDGTNGFELWRSDGTKKGTLMVRDLLEGGENPLRDGAYPTNLTNVNGALFFSAVGFLWKTDGTSSGTIKLKTVEQPRGFTGVNGSLFFVSGENLWVSDGTKAGTRIVVPGAVAERFGVGGVASLNGRLYFGANGGQGFELHETDGTLARTALVYDAEPGSGSSHAQVLGRSGDKVVFIARSESTSLWQTYSLTIPTPHAPHNLLLPSEHDSGMSSSDRVTRTQRPTITGMAPPDSLVRLFANGVEIGSTIARGGKFQILPNIELTDGTHTLTATARDDLGRTGAASEPLNVKIDTTGATVRFTAVSPQALELKFSEYVGATLAASHLTLHNLTTGERYSGHDLAVAYVDRTNTALIRFPNMPTGLARGNYRLTIDSAGVQDVAGNELRGRTSFDFAPPAGPLVGVAGSTLFVAGTAGDDSILIRRNASNPNLIEVGLNGAFTSHSAAGIASIRIEAFAGDDSIAFDHSNGVVKIQSSIYGGDGNDTIIGGAHRDRIYGGNGDDVIRGGGGHDIIYGDAGADTIFGERGNDYIVGGAGRDFIQGNQGNDRLIIETGIDDVLLDEHDTILTQLT